MIWPRLCGLFHVSGRSARIAVRGRRDAGLITTRTAARGRPLRPTPAVAGCCGVLELLAHAIELCRVLRAEPPIGEGRLLAVTSTTTTHRQTRIAGSSRTHVPWELLCTPCAGIFYNGVFSGCERSVGIRLALWQQL